MGKTPSKSKIVCFHLFNDFSGSPTVLKGILQGLLDKGENIDLMTSRSGGVLDKLHSPLLKRHGFNYKFSGHPAVTLLRFFYAQICMTLFALRYTFKKDTVFYINTILPVGPALIGKLSGKKVIYHYHENAFVKSSFYRALTKVMEQIADSIICVSAYQASFLKRKNDIHVIPNCLSADFLNKAKPDAEAAFERKNVLMIASLKEYKGVEEFIKLAEMMAEYRFTLVLNAEREEISKWLSDKNINVPDNCVINPRTNDVAPYYHDASLVLNLSNADLFVETFGMTVLEAMSSGLPVIVPTVGGVAELVEEGVTGFKISSKDLQSICYTIRDIFSDKKKYLELSKNTVLSSMNFNGEKAIREIQNVMHTA